MRQMNRTENAEIVAESSATMKSQLCNWPVQIKLAPLQAPYFDGAKLLIAADCTAYAYANFHKEFIRGKVTLIGCPKLYAVNYSEKLLSYEPDFSVWKWRQKRLYRTAESSCPGR